MDHKRNLFGRVLGDLLVMLILSTVGVFGGSLVGIMGTMLVNAFVPTAGSEFFGLEYVLEGALVGAVVGAAVGVFFGARLARR